MNERQRDKMADECLPICSLESCSAVSVVSTHCLVKMAPNLDFGKLGCFRMASQLRNFPLLMESGTVLGKVTVTRVSSSFWLGFRWWMVGVIPHIPRENKMADLFFMHH